MAAITPQQFSQLIGGFGFDAFDETAYQQFNDAVGGFVETSIAGAQAHSGGRVSMPGEFFGSAASAHTSDPAGTNPNMAHVTDAIVRPALPQTFSLAGGADGPLDTLDSIYDSTLKWLRSTVQAGGGKRIRMKPDHKQRARSMFRGIVERVFTEVRKVAKTTRHLKGTQMGRVLKKF